jgi:hypothetical protein
VNFLTAPAVWKDEKSATLRRASGARVEVLMSWSP